MSTQEVFSVEGNRVVACQLFANFPVRNPRHTSTEVKVYTSLVVIEKGGKRYLATRKRQLSSLVFSAPVGAIVSIEHQTGSRHILDHAYLKFFVVTDGQYEVVLKDRASSLREDLKCTTINLRPLEELGELELAEAEAEIRNRGLLPSLYDPVKALWHWWVKMRVADLAAVQPQQPANIDEVIAELEKQIAEKEKELAALKTKLEELRRLKSVSGRIASIASIEVK